MGTVSKRMGRSNHLHSSHQTLLNFRSYCNKRNVSCGKRKSEKGGVGGYNHIWRVPEQKSIPAMFCLCTNESDMHGVSNYTYVYNLCLFWKTMLWNLINTLILTNLIISCFFFFLCVTFLMHFNMELNSAYQYLKSHHLEACMSEYNCSAPGLVYCSLHLTTNWEIENLCTGHWARQAYTIMGLQLHR